VETAGGRAVAGVDGRGWVEDDVLKVIGAGGKWLVNGDEVLMFR
jgi:hypothetical protein